MNSDTNERVIDYSGTHFRAGALAQIFSDLTAINQPIKLLINNCTFYVGSERDFCLLKVSTNIAKLEFKNPIFLSLNGEGLLESLSSMSENKSLKEITIRNWDQPSLGQFLYYATRIKSLAHLTIENIKLDLGVALALEPILKENSESGSPIKIECTINQLRDADKAQIYENAAMFPNVIALIETTKVDDVTIKKSDEESHLARILNAPLPDALHLPVDEVNLLQMPEAIQAETSPIIMDRSKDIVKYRIGRVPTLDFEALKSHMESQLQEGVRTIDFTGSYFSNESFVEIQAVLQRNNNRQNPITLILDSCTFESGKSISQAKAELLKMPKVDA